MEAITIIIQGMTCEHCQMTIQKGLESMDGVIKAKVDLRAGKAEIQFNPELTDQQKLKQKIEDLGYKAL